MEYLDELDQAARRAALDGGGDGLGDDCGVWMDVLREEARVARKVRRAAVDVAPAPAPVSAKQDDERMAVIAAKVRERDGWPVCKDCRGRFRKLEARGLCRSCYMRIWMRERSIFKLDYTGSEPLLQMVREIAKQEKQSVSAVLLAMAASGAAKRLVASSRTRFVQKTNNKR